MHAGMGRRWKAATLVQVAVAPGMHRRALVRLGVSPQVSKKSFSSRTSRSSSAALASRASAMMRERNEGLDGALR